jgi:hypothetical protein
MTSAATRLAMVIAKHTAAAPVFEQACPAAAIDD